MSEQTPVQPPRRRVLRALLIGLAALLAVFVIVGWVGFTPYRIVSSAMEPTLSCAKAPVSPGCLGGSNDRVLACRICLDLSNPSRGDIYVFNTPQDAALKCGEGGTFVKRVIGLPGETVREDTHGFIWIKKAGSTTFLRLNEPYISQESRLADSAHFGQTWRVPDGAYFMLGDNRSESCDSRTWGAVPHADLIGPVVFRYWPLSRLDFL
jgi:signal peptidase I